MIAQQQETLSELVERARAGSREAFDLLIGHFERSVLRTALALTRNHADAQDVAQEVYVKLFRGLAAYEDRRKIECWVYRITVNAARDLCRRRRFWLPLEGIIRRTTPADPVERREIRSRLGAALGRLSFRERTVFVLADVEGLDAGEIAEILGCRPATVRGYLHEARHKLQRAFPERR